MRRRRGRRPFAILAVLAVAGGGAVVAAGASEPGGADAPPAAPIAEDSAGPADAEIARALALRRTGSSGPGSGPAVEPRGPRGAGSGAERIKWRPSIALGAHESGRLRRGVALPTGGRHWVSWDPITRRSPSRVWRRWGTDRLVRTTLRIMREFGRDRPGAPRVLIGDLSRPRGGSFGPEYGSIGHASHQNGLDIDVYYPRKDERPKPPESADQVDVRLAQDLVDRWVKAGAIRVFVGPNLPLSGPSDVVVPLAHHDNHLHARLPLE